MTMTASLMLRMNFILHLKLAWYSLARMGIFYALTHGESRGLNRTDYPRGMGSLKKAKRWEIRERLEQNLGQVTALNDYFDELQRDRCAHSQIKDGGCYPPRKTWEKGYSYRIRIFRKR